MKHLGKKQRNNPILGFSLNRIERCLFIHCCIFLFFSISCALVFSGSLVFNWHVHIPVCRKCNTVYFFTFTAQILYIFYISARRYDKTDYCLKNYFIHLYSIIFLCSIMHFVEKYHLWHRLACLKQLIMSLQFIS